MAKVWIQGVEHTAMCAVCDKELTKKQVEDWEVNQVTYTCSRECFEESI